MLRASATDVCETHAAGASLEVRSVGGFMGGWMAEIQSPSGNRMHVSGSGSDAEVVPVAAPGTYTLLEAFSLNPHCAAILQPYTGSKVVAGGGALDQPGRTVTVKVLESPAVKLSGGGTLCREGESGAMVELVIQVSRGKGPYRVRLTRDRLKYGEFQVTAGDGRLVLPVRDKGTYVVSYVKDAHKCIGRGNSNAVAVDVFPTAHAHFQQKFIGLCAGEGAQEALVGVKSHGSHGPYQVAIFSSTFVPASKYLNTSKLLRYTVVGAPQRSLPH